jgi:hypothetical protein
MSQVSFVQGLFPNGPFLYNEPEFENGIVAVSSSDDLLFLSLHFWFCVRYVPFCFTI